MMQPMDTPALESAVGQYMVKQSARGEPRITPTTLALTMAKTRTRTLPRGIPHDWQPWFVPR